MTEPASTPAPASNGDPAPAPAAPSNQAPVTSPANPVPAATSAPAANPPTPAEPVYNLKAPEGFDPAAISRVTEFAKSYGISPEKAQKLFDDTLAGQAKARADMDAALEKQKNDWHAEILADKEIGGDKFKPTMERAQKVIGEIDQKIAPGIKKILDDSGYGDHPSVVRLFAYLGNANREDSFAFGDRSTNDSRPKTLTDLLYPK